MGWRRVIPRWIEDPVWRLEILVWMRLTTRWEEDPVQVRVRVQCRG